MSVFYRIACETSNITFVFVVVVSDRIAAQKFIHMYMHQGNMAVGAATN